MTISNLEQARLQGLLDKDGLARLGHAYRDAGRRQDALEVFQEGADRFPSFAPNFVWAGDVCFDLKRFAEAERFYKQALSIDVCSVGGRIGLGHLYRRSRDRLAALNSFLSAIPFSLFNPYLYISSAWELCALNRHGEAIALLDQYERIAPSKPPSVDVARSFAHYTRQHGLDRVYSDYVDAWSRRKSFDTPALLNSIGNSISNAIPLSFIRLGDGEGCFAGHVRLSGESRFDAVRHLTEWSSHYVLTNWFGEFSDEIGLPLRDSLYNELIAAVMHADIIGIPRPARSEFEYRNDRRGFFGVSEVIFLLRKSAESCIITDADSHILLAKHPSFLRILSASRCLCTIGCHPALGAKLRSLLGVGDGQDFIIPGERGSTILPTSLKGGRHFPDRYMEILDHLQYIERGSLFLVGAGVLGKLYCARIRQAGGIAVDMGSVFDMWMGIKTRGVFEVAGISPL